MPASDLDTPPPLIHASSEYSHLMLDENNRPILIRYSPLTEAAMPPELSYAVLENRLATEPDDYVPERAEDNVMIVIIRRAQAAADFFDLSRRSAHVKKRTRGKSW